MRDFSHNFPMKIKVKLFGHLSERAGTSVTEVDASTVRELLDKLMKSQEELKGSLLAEDNKEREIKKEINVMLNGRNVRFLEGLDTELDENDSVAIFPPIGGG